MELQDFIQHIAEQFDETPIEEFTPESEFKLLDEWSSLSALSIIAMIDDEYNVTVKGEDVRTSVTIEDLFNIVSSKK